MTSPAQSSPANDFAVMEYYDDGNTVTAVWNDAQHFAMRTERSDCSWTPPVANATE